MERGSDAFFRISSRHAVHRPVSSMIRCVLMVGILSRERLHTNTHLQLPDTTVSAMYDTKDNYITDDDGTKSPKSLTELATDALCRELPHLNGDLPPGIPQDVVKDILDSLLHHSAINLTTLGKLRECDIASLPLAGCRGVTDAWLQNLSPDLKNFNSGSVSSMELEGVASSELPHFPDSESLASFELAVSSPEKQEESDVCAMTCNMAYETNSVFWDHNGWESRDPCNSSLRSNPGTLTLLDLSGSQRLTDCGLLHLRALLGSLEVVKLDGCHSLVGDGLLALSTSHSIHTLSLEGCRRLTDEAAISVSHLGSLKKLYLNGCRCITDQSLTSLASLSNLEVLGLSMCDLLTDYGMRELIHLEVLAELDLGWCRQLSDQGLDTITCQPGRSEHLRSLTLARCDVTDEGIVFLSRLKVLEEVNLSGCSSLSSSVLGSVLKDLSRLAKLDVSYCPGIMYVLRQPCVTSKIQSHFHVPSGDQDGKGVSMS